MRQDPGPRLRLRKVSKFFGIRPIFKNVSCEVSAGQVLLVAGRNGAGKSTLLKIMAGLSRPSSGSVDSLIPAAKVSYLGHSTFLYPRLTASENLAFWAGMYGLSLAERDILHRLDKVGLARVAHERAGIFSRGMAQRLTLARAFMTDPDLVYLDEPSTGLDVGSMRILYAEIEQAVARGASVVWVSHQIAQDRERADLVLSLDGKPGFVPASEYVPEGPSC